MKKIYLLLFAILILATNSEAKIWIVANYDLPADFTTLQAAHDGASAGDTIHLLGSKINYGGLTCTKQLHIFGPGYTLITNQPGILPTTAEVSTVSFSAGSEFSTLEGIDLTFSSININTSNITVQRCRVSQVGIGQIDVNTSNIVINSCYIFSALSSLNSNRYFGNNIIITNNYINILDMHETFSGIIKNNIISRLYANTDDLVGWIFENNIVTASNFNSGNGTSLLENNSVEYNLFAIEVTTANGNQQNVDMATVFVQTGSFEDQLELAAGSPAIGAAKDGGDCGVFGGPTPYVKGGQPALPTIYAIEHPGIGDDVNGLPVTIKARSQQ